MPELPEVETVKSGLAPVMEGFVFKHVQLNRPNLRFPFDPDFVARVQGMTLTRLSRRAKFLQAELSSGDRLFMHLGMSGRFTISQSETATDIGAFAHDVGANPKHDHVVFEMSSGYRVIYNAPRRFGFMELVADGAPYRLDDLGPEPLGNDFNAPALRATLKSRKSKIKAALLDQHVVAGLGNIYVCEALYRAKLSPFREAGSISIRDANRLVSAVKDVLSDAIKAGGSSLRDFHGASGELGYFQHTFAVYGREDMPCTRPRCSGWVRRTAQNGRSTFACDRCQG